MPRQPGTQHQACKSAGFKPREDVEISLKFQKGAVGDPANEIKIKYNPPPPQRIYFWNNLSCLFNSQFSVTNAF